MKRSKVFVILLLAGMTATAANGPKPRDVISNPFHEFTGIPGLKLGYGDVLAQCQTYDNATNRIPTPLSRTSTSSSATTTTRAPVSTRAAARRRTRRLSPSTPPTH